MADAIAAAARQVAHTVEASVICAFTASGMQKANLSFQQMVQVRNRLVTAYQDIMNMPV